MSAQIHKLLQNSKGFTIAEIMVVAAIFLFVAIAVTSFYLSTVRGFSLASAQAFVQRQGTFIEEEVARQLQPALALQVATCGPPGATASLIYERYIGGATSYWCMYQFQDIADTFPQLYICQIPALTGGDCQIGVPRRNLLVGAPQGAQLRVSNTTFTAVTLVTVPAVDIRFDLTDGTLLAPMRFGLTATVRN